MRKRIFGYALFAVGLGINFLILFVAFSSVVESCLAVLAFILLMAGLFFATDKRDKVSIYLNFFLAVNVVANFLKLDLWVTLILGVLGVIGIRQYAKNIKDD